MSSVVEEIKDGSSDILKDMLSKLYAHMEIKRIRMPPKFDVISRLWLRDSPFYSEFMMRFNFFMTDGIDTFGVNCINGHINLYFNPKFLDGGEEFIKYDKKTHKPIIKKDKSGNQILGANGVEYEKEIWPGLQTFKDGTSEIEGILVHEIMHLVLLSQERALDDADVWNIASDMIINDMISKMTINGRKLPLPDGGVYLEEAVKYGYTGPAITEDLYHWLISKRTEMENGNGKNNSGDGNGDSKNGDGYFESIFKSHIDEHTLLRDNDSLTESILDDIVNCAQVKGWGTASGDGVEMLKDLLKSSKVNWKRELRHALSTTVHGFGSQRIDSWSRPNRRHLPLPGNKRLENKITVFIDTSGSIGNDELEQFFAEIESIVRDFSKLAIVQWDTKIKSVSENYRRGKWKDIKITGRGGTDPQCVFDWIKDNNLMKYPAVILTDGYFDNNFNVYQSKIIWCVTERNNNPPHGKVIHIDIDRNR